MTIQTDFFFPSDIDEIIEALGSLSQEFSGKKILITGGQGFLGRYFIEVFARMNAKVLTSPCEVTSVDNLITAGPFGRRVVNHKHIKFIEHDMVKPLPLEGHFDFVLHGAGIASPFYYKANPLETLDVAVNGTRNTLEIARQSGARMLFFSSSEIYGDPDPQSIPTPETYRGNVACLGPRACYDESKRLGETLCQIYYEQFGVAACMVRPFNVFGPGMQQTDYRVLPNFASQIAQGKPLKIYGSGNQTRTFCYIVDAMVGFLRVLVRGVSGEPYNIGNPEPEISMRSLCHLVADLAERVVPYDVVAYPECYPADEPNRRCPDITKAKLHLGYNPKIPLREGLSRFLSWAEANYHKEISP